MYRECPVPDRPSDVDPFTAEEMGHIVKWLKEIQDVRGDVMPALKILFVGAIADRADAEWTRVILSSTLKHTIRVCPQETPTSKTEASIVVGNAMPVWGVRIVPAAQAQDIAGILERLALSQRAESQAAEQSHQQAIQRIQQDNAKALAAVMEGVRDNTAAVAKTQRLKTESIDSHAGTMVGVIILAVRQKYPRMRFAPLEPEYKVFGACSREAISMYLGVLTEGESIFEEETKAGNGDTAKRKEVVALLQSDPEYKVLLRRWFVMNSKDEKDPFCRWSIAFESWTARFKGDFEKKPHKDKICAKFLYAMVAKEDISYTIENAALLSDAGLDRATTVPGLSFKTPRSYANKKCEPFIPSPRKIDLGKENGTQRSTSQQSGKPVAACKPAATGTTGTRGSHGKPNAGIKAQKGGGSGTDDILASMADDNDEPPKIPAQFAGFQALQRATPYKPFRPELELGAYITDGVLDAIIGSLGRILDPDTAVLYPDLLTKWVRGQADPSGAFWRKVGKNRFIAPINIDGNHWVLLVGKPGEVLIYDSLPNHTKDRAAVVAREVGRLSTDYAQATVRSVAWYTQGPGNDCALYCMRAALAVLSGRQHDEVKDAFSRRLVDEVLPRLPANKLGASWRSIDAQLTGALKLTAKVVDHHACSDPQCYAGGKLARGESAVVCAGCGHRWHKACYGEEYRKAGYRGNGWFCVGCRSRTRPADPKPPAAQPQRKEPAPPTPQSQRKDPAPPTPQAQSPAPAAKQQQQTTNCLFKGRGSDHPCGALLGPKSATIQCPGCKVVICKKHANHNARKAGTWRCEACRPAAAAPADEVRCGQPHCNIHMGRVSASAAWNCSMCQQPFHKQHFSVKGAEEVVCNACRRGQHKVMSGDYSLETDDPSRLPPPPPDSDFRNGQGRPLLTMAGGALHASLQGTLSANMHPLARRGVSAQGRAEHLRLLRLVANAPRRLHGLPLPRMILEILERERYKHQWEWSTMENKGGQMAGALNRLPQYTEGNLAPIYLSESREWTDAQNTFRTLARQTAPRSLPAVSFEDVSKAIETAVETVMIALIITWACLARLGDVTQLKAANVEMRAREEKSMTDLSIYFETGKIIGKVDPYWVHTAIPTDLAEALQRYLDRMQHSKFLFPMPSKRTREAFMKQVRTHLRTINPRYDSRGLRRGAAQNLANQGVPLARIMELTKHADLGMLKRYLGYGKSLSEEARKSTDIAATKLWKSRSS